MDSEIRAQFEETRRHFDVVAEGMRADVQLVAEGLSVLGDRVDRLEQSLREEVHQTRQDLSAMIAASHQELDRKIEQTRQDVRGKIQETRQDLSTMIQGSHRDLDRKIQRLRRTHRN